MIDVDIRLAVSDGARRFELAARFATDVSFAALYGPSGAGKSLTLQALAGLRRPDAGHVRLDGRTLFDARAGIDVAAPQRRIGYLFQDYALFPHLSVRDNVAFGLTSWWRRRPTGADARAVDGLLERFGLAAMAGSRPGNLSGGQRQRTALARALACQPQVLLLDEPFAALNPMLRGELRRDLAQVQREWNIPVLMITHDIEDVLTLAQAAFVYRDGQVVREVDLRAGESREVAVRALEPASETVESPWKSRLRQMLEPAPGGRPLSGER